MPLIYFAAPLFNDAEKAFNITITEKCEKIGYTVFLPQRDGIEMNKEPYASMVKEQRDLKLFCLDRDTVLACDIFLFILDGRVPDEGAALELGICYTDKFLNNKNRLLLGLHTDVRAAFYQEKLNPMLKVPLDKIFKTPADLLDFLHKNFENKQ